MAAKQVKAEETQLHYRTCHLCEAMCGLEIELKGGDIVSIRGDKADPLSRGHLCPKAVALQDIHHDPDRIREPMIREGEQWRAVTWDEALDYVVSRIAPIHKEHGGQAFGLYLGNPNVHNYGMMTHGNLFYRLLRTRQRFSATSVDQLPAQLMAYWMYGHQLLLPIPDIDRSQYFLMLGANPLASNGSLMTVPDVRKRIKALQNRGGKLVVVDPRRTETASIADQHLFIRPGTDAAFLAALLHTIHEEELADPGKLAQIAQGLDDVYAALGGMTPEAVAATTGIEASAIRLIARELANSEAGVVYGRMGVSTQRHGTLCQWLIQLLNIATGNLDRPGGALFTKPAIDLIDGHGSKPGHFGAWHSRVRGLPEFSSELPVSVLAEEIMTPGEGQIRAMVVAAGNPVLSTPNGVQLEEALGQLDFMLAFDFYLNETTRFADVILPPTSPLEHDHYDLIFHIFAVHNTVRYSPALFEKPEGAMHDWEIFEALATRLAPALGKDIPVSPSPTEILDVGLQMGPYGSMQGHALALDLETVKKYPHGLDLGPLTPSLPERLHHADKKIQCALPPLLEALEMLKRELQAPPTPNKTFSLIGRRDLRSNNSWMHNSQRLVRGKHRCVLFMHPQDMQAHHIEDGDKVALRSRVGRVEIVVEVSEAVMPGVVCAPHGWGHDRTGIGLSVASQHAGVSVNDITDEHWLDPISGNAALNGLPVDIEVL